MRALLLGAGSLGAVLLIPLLLIATFLGSLPAAPPTGADHASLANLAQPTPYRGGGAGCTERDPTGGRCLTPITRHAYDEIVRTFGPPAPGSPILSANCWGQRAGNSEHPLGRACDYFPARFGQFPQGQDLANGWRLAGWLRANAEPLRVKYIIWQGRFWAPEVVDTEGWGRRYTGGGLHDPRDVTGGHFDHVHVSYRE
ncbi:hypothetical protein [Pseudonocardia sp. GCM10023141]|uniref:hypothetical protein n=1 Tax=Pseudonocardia sp. GCM10023141 TaxID=3252653 RepID=UPI0036067EA4